jgi:hypothetical protein
MAFEISNLQKTVLQSEIRSMTLACNKVEGINLAQAGENMGRFCFAKEEAVIDEVCRRLKAF